MHLAIETRLPLSLRGVALAALLVGALVITPGVALADETRHVGGGQQAGTVGDDDAASLAADPESDGSAATTAAPGGANTTSRSDARGPTATAGGPSGSAAGASGGWTTDPKEIIG